MAVQFVLPRQTVFDLNGNPVPGARVYFDAPGTSDEKDVFSNEGLTTVVNQPVVADAAARIQRLYMDGKYKVTVKDADDVLIYTEDNCDFGLSTALGTTEALPINAGGTGGTTAASARANLGVPSQAQVTQNTTNIADHDTKIDTGLHSSGTRFGTAAQEDSGTSGNAIGLLDGDNTHSGENTFSSTSGATARNTAKAWATFSATGGSISFNSSTQGFNVASVTRQGTGDFDIAFTSNLPTANYAVHVSGYGGTTAGRIFAVTDKAVGGFTIAARSVSGPLDDPDLVDFVVFGF